MGIGTAGTVGFGKEARCTPLDAICPGTAYVCHALHSQTAVWVEKNCYIDVWIEVLHALGLEPRAMLGFTLAIDFDSDQWTFFKPPHGELFDLFGFDVQELNVWRPLLAHALDHLARGSLLSTEADAFWLPDTGGTDYRRNHTKTTIVLLRVDAQREQATYFHNAGCFTLDGDDFRGLFGRGERRDTKELPLFAEAIRTARLVRRSESDLVTQSKRLFARHFARRPVDNPVRRFAEHWTSERVSQADKGLDHYHAWAFATLRQLGAAFELAAHGLRYLADRGEPYFEQPIADFERIAVGAKTLVLKGARSVSSGRPLSADSLLDDMASAWDRAMEHLGDPRALLFDSPDSR